MSHSAATSPLPSAHLLAAHRRRLAQRGRRSRGSGSPPSRCMSPTTTCSNPTPAPRPAITSSAGLVPLALLASRPAVSTRACAPARERPSRSSSASWASSARSRPSTTRGTPGRRATTTPGCSSIPGGLRCCSASALVTLWRSRRRDDRLWWRYARRLAARRGRRRRRVHRRHAVASRTSSRTPRKAHVPAANLGAPHENVEFKTSDGLRLKGWYVPSRNGAAVISFAGRRDTQRQRGCSSATATACCCSTAAARARARATRTSSAGRASATSTAQSRSCSAAPTSIRERIGAHRALGRRRDADRGRRRVDRAQGDRLRGRERPLRPRHAREPGDRVAERHRHAASPPWRRRSSPTTCRRRRSGASCRRSATAPCSSSTASAGQAEEKPANTGFYELARGRRRSGRSRAPST